MSAPGSSPTRVVGRRTVAWLVDLVPVVLLYVLLVVALGDEVPVAALDPFDPFDPSGGSGFETSASAEASLSLGDTEYRVTGGEALLVMLLPLAYAVGNLVLLQGLTGSSVGKRVAGLAVVRPDGTVCGVGKAAVRWLLLVVDAFPYVVPLVGFVMVLSTAGNRRLGDLAAGTYVVRRRDVGRPVAAAAAGPTGAQGARPTEPQWDAARGAWVRWDGTGWVQHDQRTDAWVPLR